MKGSDRAPRHERATRLMAVIAGGALLGCAVLAMVKLLGLLGASAGPVDTWKVLLGVLVLSGLVAAVVVAWRVYDQGLAGARQVGAWLTQTTGGKTLNGLVCIALGANALLYGLAASGWSQVSSLAVAVLWSTVGVHLLYNGWRQWAAQRQLSRYGPDSERIPE